MVTIDGWFYVLVFIAGLFLLVKGADLVTEHAEKLSRKLGISQLLIGITLVAMSTSLPELAVSILSVITETANIATGMIIGSNMANIGLILGLSALTFPFILNKKEFLEEGKGMLIFTLFLAIFLIDGMVWYEGLALLTGFFMYNYRLFKKKPERNILTETLEKYYLKISDRRTHIHFLVIAFGATLIIVGANLLVDSTINIAKWLGVSELLIALIAVAIGTSLPELATSFVAAVKRMRGISIGNIIGSNIFNIAILGFASLFNTIPITPKIVLINIPIMVGMSFLLLVFMKTDSRISRFEGLILLLVYLAFVAIQFL